MNSYVRSNGLYPVLIVFLIAWLNICSSYGQLTFSKGWKVGKRTDDETDAQLKITTNALCQFLLSQIRDIFPCENHQISNKQFESILNNQL
ncbi:uncharacterized protein LOC130444862 isoform X2 [Diorhabda sublineata]|uniref:uncharacterized protein LOC130444862 isoform X2 n=1 Tax=Diorhabda sublineata TaxID=1163346 RepID=UPI0024E0A1E1|nr:uncharacterized protein LOC130444862 isoform X2 [Diorhabda sublineata]XP_056636159.1 uncharacterized protein LOC130444862 isoform X2 [Diorhabda sublineata]XP_056636161.1 uncharacterized protein LOC130444862 isoform X2 [Diorhabda sublineata]